MSSDAKIFESLCAEVLDTVVAARHTIDERFGKLPELMIRRQFATVLSNMKAYLEAPSPIELHQSVAKWTAVLLGMGLSPQGVMRSVVTLGDFVVQISKNTLAEGPAANRFVREIVRLNFNAVREVVAILNAELKQARAHRLSRGA